MTPLFPPQIRTVAVVSPSGPVAPEVFSAGAAALREAGVRVKIMPHAAGKNDPDLFHRLRAMKSEGRAPL